MDVATLYSMKGLSVEKNTSVFTTSISEVDGHESESCGHGQLSGIPVGAAKRVSSRGKETLTHKLEELIFWASRIII